MLQLLLLLRLLPMVQVLLLQLPTAADSYAAAFTDYCYAAVLLLFTTLLLLLLLIIILTISTMWLPSHVTN